MQIISTIPQDGQTGVGILEHVKITFDSPIDPLSITDSSIVVTSMQKDTVMVDSDGIPIASNSLLDRTLFTDTFNKALDGSVAIDNDDPNTLVFTPKIGFKVATEYKVIVSNTIADTDGVLLQHIYAFSFTTTSEEQVLSTPVDESTTILDSTLITEDVHPVSDGFSIVESMPSNHDMFIDYTQWQITMSEDVDSATVQDNVRVFVSGILEDITTSVDVVLSATGATILIETVDSSINMTNKMFEIRLLPGLKSTSGNSLGKITSIFFLSTISPYYGSVNLMRFLAGPLINDIEDFTLAIGLYYYSSLAYRVFRGVRAQDIQEVLSRYAVINTLYTLIRNSLASTFSGKVNKVLGNFQIQVDNGVQAQINNNLLSSLKDEIQALNLYASLLKSKPLMRGVESGDYPTDIGRLWETSRGNRNEPPGDVKNRALGTFRSRW